MWKESEPVRGTYFLERAEVGASWYIERKKASKGHLHPGEKVKTGNKTEESMASQQGYSLPREGRGSDWSGH